MKILFMCVANSARSQLAEALAKSILGPAHQIESAGSKPTRVNPFAIAVLEEIGIDVSTHSSKTVDQLPEDFKKDLDVVITLCAEEVCPLYITRARKLHWPHPDPAVAGLSDEESLKRFRQTRDALAEKLREFARTIA